MEIHNTGYWITETPKHWFDGKLYHFISKILENKNVKSLVDFGCGDAGYIKYFKNKLYCEAYDGNPYTEIITNGLGRTLNLSEKFYLDKKFDCVLSLEVGEHIPEQYEQIFIDNLVNHSNDLIIISWAIPGQGGEGHFNERDNRYIINEFEKRGFKINREETFKLRKNASISWFKHTIMVFEKQL